MYIQECVKLLTQVIFMKIIKKDTISQKLKHGTHASARARDLHIQECFFLFLQWVADKLSRLETSCLISLYKKPVPQL